ncbi:small oligopeptide transporter [Meira miltonrushii]|uniref:Small oligopeptide transporter n=1 Tax=Meira miltonrushii TaxID=1280837 RepID=A0A316VC44_9BASI|nr:small oligopeptide transporter [Meira miltonrushii]PWN33125.1 small oligopeptide transporter [Meira miltonrushii]
MLMHDTGLGKKYAAEDSPSEEKASISSNNEALAPLADEALAHLSKMKKQANHWDPNLPDEVEDELDEALHTTDVKAQIHIAEELLENSPYPEVRAAVLNYDDGAHCNTIRAWVLGMIFATLGSGLNCLFSLRDPYIVITSYVAQVVSFPIGLAWAKFLPECKFTIFGKTICLNPGKFTMKEHTIIVIMANATFASGAAYGTDIITAQRAFYNQRYGWPFEIFVTMTTMAMGFGMAGIFNRFLVQPAAMIWPSNLINTAMMSALHDHSAPDPAKTNGWKIGRYRLFTYTMIASFCWYWFPGYITPFLSVFAFVTWIRPQNPVINQLFGGISGLSLIPITFDWTQISGFNYSPLISPWHAIANTLIGMVSFYWILAIGLHYSNYGYAKYLPMSDSNSYDNTGNPYNVTRILHAGTQTLDLAEYKTYSPLFLSTTFTISYGLSFASILAVLVHTYLFHGTELWQRFKKWNDLEEDVHAKLMAKYKTVPFWWYAVLLVATIAVALAMILYYPTNLSWWAFFVSLILALIFFMPIAIIQATTNIGIGLNVLTEFMVGYIQPGRPMAMMLFKAYGYMALYQGIGFASDMKLGHYMKVPPRVTFSAQVIACVWSAVVQVSVLNWSLGSISDICTQQQKYHFSCPNGRVFYTASVVWGLVGPQRIFSPGQLYNGMLYFFIPGLLVPIVIYMAARRWPRSSIRFLNGPILFGGAGLIPPATPLNYLAWGMVGFVFNKFIRTRFRGWWMQYNYIFSAGLDVGLALSTIVLFCALELTNINFPNYWGDNSTTGALMRCKLSLQKGSTLGLRCGSYVE